MTKFSDKKNRMVCMGLDAAIMLLFVVLIYVLAGRSARVHFEVDRSTYPVKGIDLSAHNGKVDFARLKADTVDFVYIKATEGADFCDANFAINYEGVVEQGMPVGAYHYFRFNTPAARQAEHFLVSVQGRRFDLPLVIDVERWGNVQDYDIDSVRANLSRFVQIIRRSGYEPMIYTNKRDYAAFVKDNVDDVRLWVCSLSATPPEGDWTLWQHSHGARLGATKSEVDLNTCGGGRETLKALVDTFTVRVVDDTVSIKTSVQ